MYAILLPLLPLLTALMVTVGDDRSCRARTQLAAFPIGAAFCGAVAILYVVATQGPISVRFYDPASTAALTFHARPRTGGIVRPKNGRTAVTAVDVLAGLANVIRPLALTGASPISTVLALA